MFRRRALAAGLVLLALQTAHLTVSADSGMYLPIYGYVISHEDGLLQLAAEPDMPGGPGLVTLSAGRARMYDLLTGFPAYADAVLPGMIVRAACGPDGQVSELWLNCGDEDAAAFRATVSENLQHVGDESVFLTIDGKYRIILSPSTLILDPRAGFLSPRDIRPGDEMFIWVDLVTASSPAQVYPEKVVLIY